MVLLQFSWRRGSKDSRGQGVKCMLSTAAILEGKLATALLICNVKSNLSSSEDTVGFVFL